MKMEIELPFLATFEDYHMFQNWKDDLNKIVSGTVDFEEIGCFDGLYKAVFFEENHPISNPEKIKLILEKEQLKDNAAIEAFLTQEDYGFSEEDIQAGIKMTKTSKKKKFK